MQKLLKIPFYIISLLPWWSIRLLSDVLFLILFHVIKYRRKVVFKNLKNSFPSKSILEIKQIERNHYRYFADLMTESTKLFSISQKELADHVKILNKEVLLKYLEANQSIIVVLGHYGNWEFAGARFAMELPTQLKAIYHPLTNPYFDQLFIDLRSRFGNELYPMEDTVRKMFKNRNETTLTAFIADQTPSKHHAFWLPFLNQDTPVYKGTEMLAKKFNHPVVYATVNRVKRNYYEIKFEELCVNSSTTSDQEITKLHLAKLERDINNQPETWLWTHRRWKHKRPV